MSPLSFVHKTKSILILSISLHLFLCDCCSSLNCQNTKLLIILIMVGQEKPHYVTLAPERVLSKTSNVTYWNVWVIHVQGPVIDWWCFFVPTTWQERTSIMSLALWMFWALKTMIYFVLLMGWSLSSVYLVHSAIQNILFI